MTDSHYGDTCKRFPLAVPDTALRRPVAADDDMQLLWSHTLPSSYRHLYRVLPGLEVSFCKIRASTEEAQMKCRLPQVTNDDDRLKVPDLLWQMVSPCLMLTTS